MSDKLLKKAFGLFVLLMSATLLYGGYQVQTELGRRDDYERGVREKLRFVDAVLCEEISKGSYRQGLQLEDPVSFLRVCAEKN
jgi:hypothetical protein